MTTVLLLWGLTLAARTFPLLAVWQRKEYRLDRLFSYLREPHIRHIRTWRLSALILCLGVITQAFPSFLLLPELFYGARFLLVARAIQKREFDRPQWTAKSSVLFCLLFLLVLFEGMSFLVFAAPLSLLLFYDLSFPLVSAAIIALVTVGTNGMKRRTIRNAIAYRKTLTHLRVVGITGSYGKSSTKEYVATFLGQSDEIMKTPKNTNTEIGVASFLLASVQHTHRFFVCEMGAYKKGEIRTLASIAQPEIGILTAIGPEHLDLFGSLENIRSGKMELLYALPPSGTAIFNIDNAECAQLAKTFTHCRSIKTGTHPDADIRATDIEEHVEGIRFTLHTPHGTWDMSLPLLGAFQLQNVLAAIAGALACGVSEEDISARARHLAPLPGTMSMRTLADGTLVLDDSYNANPDGVREAFRTLSLFQKTRRVVVFPPLIELGEVAKQAHVDIGVAAGTYATDILFYGSDFLQSVEAGVRTTPFSKAVIHSTRVDKILHVLHPLRGPDTIILLEGRVPRRLREALLHPL